MAAKRQKLETEVLRIRNQGHWEKLDEGLRDLVKKYGSSDPVVRLLKCEVDLETFLLEQEPRPENVAKAQTSLVSVKRSLTDLKTSESKNSQIQVSEEAVLLLAKIDYAQGNVSACLDAYKDINFAVAFESNCPLYKIKMIAEAYSVKGLCLEQVPSSSSQKDTKLQLECYEQVVKLVIKYLVEYEKVFNTRSMISDETLISYLLETSVHRCIILHIKNNNIWSGIHILRLLLKTLHSHLSSHFQQALSCKLAMVLLRGTSTVTYKPADNTKKVDNSSPFIGMDKNEFQPVTAEQEAILLLLISEIMLNMDPVLDMSPEHSTSREETLCNAETLYNLLCVATSYLNQFELLSSCIEKSLKYAFDQYHIWHQFALSLCAAGKNSQAVSSFAECCRIKPSDPVSAIFAAKTCFEQQPQRIDEGLEYSHLAVSMSEESFDADGMQSRAHLCVGVGMTLKALLSNSSKKQVVYRNIARSSYTKAHSLDPSDYKPILFLAMEFACARKLSLAFKKVKQALDLNPESLVALHLLTLLLSARGQYNEARQTLHSALHMYPNDISLLATKCKLELHIGENHDALRTCDDVMKIWASKSDFSPVNLHDSTADRMTNDGLSVTNLSCDFDAGSIVAGSMVASKYGQTASEITSSLADLQPKLSPLSSVRIEAWLQVAEVYLALDRSEDAEMCVTEASQICTLSPSVLYMKGRLRESRDEIADACTMYNNALTVDPSHVRAIEHLANALKLQGRLEFAKKLLEDAVKLDVTSHSIWKQLADVGEGEGDIDGAIKCTTFALSLEESSPVVPFTILIPHL